GPRRAARGSQDHDGEGVRAGVAGREGVVGRQGRGPVGAGEVDRAGVAADRAVVGVQGGDRDADGRAGGDGGGRGRDLEVRDRGRRGRQAYQVRDHLVGYRRAAAGDQVVIRPGRVRRARRVAAALAVAGGDVVEVGRRQLVDR